MKASYKARHQKGYCWFLDTKNINETYTPYIITIGAEEKPKKKLDKQNKDVDSRTDIE